MNFHNENEVDYNIRMKGEGEAAEEQGGIDISIFEKIMIDTIEATKEILLEKYYETHLDTDTLIGLLEYEDVFKRLTKTL